MLDYVQQLLDSGSLSPHGTAPLWRPELVWTHVVSDAIIGLSYFFILLMLAKIFTRSRGAAFGWMFWCVAIFVLTCGTTHLMSVWTVWVPVYEAETLIKAATAVASIATAIALWPLLPRVLALQGPTALQVANEDLNDRTRERDDALQGLQRETAERVKVEDMLRQAQKMEALGQLTGGVVHDFNNLLTAIVGNVERIDRMLPDANARTKKSIVGALAAADKAGGLVQQLLAFARQQPAQPRPTDLNVVVVGLHDLLQRTMNEQVTLVLDLAASLPAALVDVNQLENAIINLAVNARDAMPRGGEFTIRTAVAADGGPKAATFVLLEVRDTGTGMAPEVTERAFEPFFTTKGAGRGSGLGLSQVYGFVNQSNGQVALDSVVGEGTCVRILLPQASSQAPQEDARASPDGQGSPQRLALAG